MKEAVGFIGLGVMGKPMATNLMRGGFALSVYNRSSSPVEELVRSGARRASSSKEVGRLSEVVVTSLPTTAAVEEVVSGPNGIVQGMGRGGVVIDTSTIHPSAARRIAARLAESGIDYLDAPVSGGPERAAEGTLTFMVGGDGPVLDRCRPILRTMGNYIFHLGPVGAGLMAKLVNQILVALNSLAACETLAWAERYGANLNKIVDVIKTSAGNSYMFERSAPQIVHNAFTAGFQTRLIHKDLEIALEIASEIGQPLILSPLAFETLKGALSHGWGEVDVASVIRFLRSLRGQ